MFRLIVILLRLSALIIAILFTAALLSM